MTQIGDWLFIEFASSLNQDLAALGSRLRIATSAPEEGWMDLLASGGIRLGQIPDDVSATAIKAFEDILDRADVTRTVD